MLDWQIAAVGPGETWIVVRPEDEGMIADLYPDVSIVTAEPGGPGRALAAGLAAMPHDEPVVVAFADSWFTDLPLHVADWIGVGMAEGPRYWDVLRDGVVRYEYVPAGFVRRACVGVYSFENPKLVSHIAQRWANTAGGAELPMGPILNAYRPKFAMPIGSWQDTGDMAALGEFRVPA